MVMNRRGGHILAFALATCGTFTAARATDLSATVSSTECSLEEVVGINVEVLNPTQASAPVPDATADFEIRLVAGPARSSNTTIINGVMDSRVTYTYTFEARPKRTGKISLPGFSLTDGGTTYRTKPVVISVTKTAGKGNGDVFAKVIVPRTTAFLGEPVDARLEVFVKQYTQQGIQPFTVNTTFQLSQLNISRFGVFEKAMTNTPNYRMPKLRDDRGILADYFVFYWEASIYPKEVGPFDFGDILIAWKYPTFVTRGFMGLDLNNPRNLRVVPELPALEIKPIPLEGRPPDYNGAIGTFTYQVNASPRVAPVGDPITLTMTIRSSDAPLDRVSPPRLDQVPGLTKILSFPENRSQATCRPGRSPFLKRFGRCARMSRNCRPCRSASSIRKRQPMRRSGRRRFP
ncbi:MAG: BatD family protein [Planctomycetes bacterium]|nr:BatD family protein [Planctomycetota bacterium]